MSVDNQCQTYENWDKNFQEEWNFSMNVALKKFNFWNIVDNLL